MNNEPIIIVDDDEDDLEIIKFAFQQMNIENEVITFNDGFSFLDFIKSMPRRAFFIMCDINMSPLGGIELKQKIFEDDKLRMRCIPFVFMSTSNASSAIMKAYSFGVQGYFVKPSSIERLKEMLGGIVYYWSNSQRPNS